MAKGYASHTEGGKTTANGAYAHAEGFYNFADGAYSHAEGMNTRANGERSHAQNAGTTANGDYSTAEGWGTVADGTAQTVMGCFNAAIADDGTEAAYLVIGNGTRDEERSNALVSRKDGRLTIGMDPLNNMDVTTKQYVDNYISEQISQFKKPWAQENWILTGDSVLASTDYISSYGIDLTNKRFFELINQKTGININNYAVSGMGLVRKGQGQMTIPAQCGGYAFT